MKKINENIVVGNGLATQDNLQALYGVDYGKKRNFI